MANIPRVSRNTDVNEDGHVRDSPYLTSIKGQLRVDVLYHGPCYDYLELHYVVECSTEFAYPDSQLCHSQEITVDFIAVQSLGNERSAEWYKIDNPAAFAPGPTREAAKP